MEMMRDLARKHGRGVVVVTHDTRVIDFADRSAQMEDGRIAQQEKVTLKRKGPGPVPGVGPQITGLAEAAMNIC
jgi:energy-coupling factor transporter ATP-binding protein EcfA2